MGWGSRPSIQAEAEPAWRRAPDLPYLLRGVEVMRVTRYGDRHHLRRMAGGFVYLARSWIGTAVRVSWSLSVTMEADFCIEALKRALRRGRPEIFNSDQGSQFTSEKFTGELKRRGITISMDGGGCCFDNIFIERLWRSLKYEEIYLRDYALVPEARTASETGSVLQQERPIRAWATGHRRSCTGMRTRNQFGIDKEGGIVELGRCPKPRGLTLSGQNV